MDLKILTNRREKLGELMNDNEMMVIFSDVSPSYPRAFKQENNFLYFTGLEIPDAALLAMKTKGKTNFWLFIDRDIPEMVVWMGEKMSKIQAKELSGIETISYYDEFKRSAGNWLGASETCFVNKLNSKLNGNLNREQTFVKKVRDHYPALKFANLNKLMTPLRSVKDDYELEQLQKAIDATGRGIKRIYAEAKAGMMEYELEARLNFEVQVSGLAHMGFKSIVAAGKNATTLHYEANNTEVGKKELVLLDVGAGCNNYSADISRTFPVSGKFTARQKAVYQEVLDVQKAIIAMVKPGVSMVDLNTKTNELITAALKRLGLIEEDKHFRAYYMHSIGHHLGMDTHDLGARDSVLKPGNVITVEPGIYIKDEGIGVRIEDDILVTEEGHRNLSSHIPKEVEDLEAICGK